MSEQVAKALSGRQERKKFLQHVIFQNKGLTTNEVMGIFTKRFGVSHRTFGEYLSDLVNEGMIRQDEDNDTGRLVWYPYNSGPDKKETEKQ